jgi:pimeloyl-ACP methyl ester carboxylesterase
VNQEEWFSADERVHIRLRSGAFEIFCRVRGSGPWLTFLHAFPTSSWDWAKVVPGLESRFRVLCFDFLGFGDSDKPRDHPYSILEQSDLTEAVWRHFGVEETGVVAHDYGATVALELMARHIEQALSTRISRFVLLNSALYAHLGRPLLIQRVLGKPILGPLVARAMTERAFARSFSSVFSTRHPIRDSEVREHWQALTRRGSSVPVSPRLVRYIAERKLHAARWEGALESRDPPKTFLWGMSDPRSGAHVAEHIRRRMPMAPLEPLPEVGHYPQLEVPDLVAKEISAAFRVND